MNYAFRTPVSGQHQQTIVKYKTGDTMQIKFKKLCRKAVAPKQGTPGSAGFDLTATDIRKDCGQDFLHRYFTGIAVEIPPGYVGLIFPRSSIFRTGMLLTNCVGVIDSDYRGEIQAVFAGIKPAYNVGDRICQLVVVPIPQVEYVEVTELSGTGRGTGGYGSTGK